MEGSFSNNGFIQLEVVEESRRDIFKWREKRRTKRSGFHGRIYEITKLFIDRSLVRSFTNTLSIVVAFQMLLAGLCTYACVKLDLEFDVHMSLFVSPIVFPLAFSINANYQRRETVLEDLAMFKSSALILFFCHRDWIKAIGLPVDLLRTLSNKLKSLVINIREYLLTEDCQKRNVILQAVYEDFSDISQLNDKLRASELKSNSALIARIIHCHNLMCWSFERLRVIREYKSPRSLRSFTKMFIFLMPLLLSPYYVYSGRQTQTIWAPYYISVVVSFLFGSLQAVQDKLDDPFDGIGEDDVNLGQLDEWTTHSLLTNRTVTIGRFTVTTTTAKDEITDDTSPTETRLKQHEETYIQTTSPKKARRVLSRKRNTDYAKCPRVGLDDKEFSDQLEARCHGIASKLEGLTGSTTILPGNRAPYVFQEMQSVASPMTSHPVPGSMTDSLSEALAGDVDKPSSVRFLFPDENNLEVIKEGDENSGVRPTDTSLPVSQHDAANQVATPVQGQDDIVQEKRPTVMELFANEPGSSKSVASQPITIESATTAGNTEHPPELPSNDADAPYPTETETRPCSESRRTTSPDSSGEQDSCDAPLRSNSGQLQPPLSDSEADLEPKLRFSSGGGKRRPWSIPDSVNKWRKRRQKRHPENVDHVKSDTEMKTTTSMSPLLSDETISDAQDNTSELDSSLDTNIPSERKSFDKKPGRFTISQGYVSQNTEPFSEKTERAQRDRKSRFDVGPSGLT